MYTTCVQYPWKPENDTGSPGTGVTVVSQLMWVLEIELRSSTRTVGVLNH